MTVERAGSTGRITEVARMAGVSVGTVSNYFNHPERVSPQSKARVSEAIRVVGYVRNDAARQLRIGHSRSIGLVLLDVGNPFFTEIARAAEDVADAHGYKVVLGNSDESESREGGYIDLFEAQRVRGLLVAPVGDVGSRLAAARRQGIEAVVIDRSMAGTAISSVSVNDEAGGFMAAQHLLDDGRRRLVFVTGPVSVQQSRDRLAGARRAVEGTAGASLEVVELAAASALEARAFGASLAERPPSGRPDAVFAVNDVVALGVLQSTISRDGSGLSVPDDIAIVGYDDIDFAEAAVVPLTSVRQPTRLLGSRAMELLLERIDDRRAEPQHIVFEPELVVRDSTVNPLDTPEGLE
ncbi:LacI family DNA-binding transcriptional regulator [Schumannella luteola]